ncbi:hypothetical protein EUGRSUZ_B01771 [Eucalyptus grandis]|uniref:J domain-containing protein n=2 Tax=Eucalyptus grandis TaxID=71139 RepID=A0A059D451_EUCGR|nr:hypothetical protein EUGRSUZ_B01771 [Eucalyptus grandis]
MECNKEEAVRAKEIAEVRMRNNDFAGALRLVQKAQRLFSELENVSRMLAVCEIHCSAQTKVCGSEHDWYAILQIEKSADDITIKKQYRKFALLLHPDKNKFPGAEAAFKLIVEANRVLTDQLQRKLYDSKFRNSVQPQKPPAHQQTQYSGARRKNGTRNKSESHHNSQFPSSNPDQQGQQKTFWTSCPKCNVRYQYYKQFVNKTLRCQECKGPFTAYDFSTQGMAPGQQWSHFADQPDFSNSGFSKATPQATNGVPPPMHSADSFSGFVPLTKQKEHGEVAGSSRAKVADESVDKGAGMKEDRMPYGNAARPTGMGSQSTTGRMSSGNSGVEFGGNSENVSRNDTVGDAGTSEDVIKPSQSNSELNGAMKSQQEQRPTRKSSRLRQHTSYNDNSVGDDDFVSPPKRLRANEALDSAEAKKEEGIVEGFSNDCRSTFSIPENGINEDIKNEEVLPQEESLSGTDSGKIKPEEKRGEAVSADKHNEKSKSNSSSGLSPGLEPHFVVCADPEFSDFEKDKAPTCFAVNQVWAVYDTLDGMPRFYARIKKVFLPDFKVQITWLEADPDDQDEIDWCDNELPVACGKYRTGHTEDAVDHLMFSHQIKCLKGARRGSFLVYPRKGEIWALFKNWDIKWASEPGKCLPFKYEFVEILSDFVKDCGIKVVYLSKVKGFVCLFQRVDACKDANASFEIAPRDLYRFSHRVPSFVMTGNERRGVPAGSFELDPAALDIDDLRDTMEKKSADADVRKRVPKNSTVETSPVRRSPRALSKQR